MNKPTWWNDKHEGVWDRVKDAMKRDWDQTKNDLSKSKGKDLDQSAGDTLKQAAGKEPIPAPSEPNDKPADNVDKWDDAQDAYRFGAGANAQYSKDHPTWNDKLEGTLSKDWGDLKSGKDWNDVKAHVKNAWHSLKN